MRWQAPEECPSGGEIAADVLGLVLPKREFADQLIAEARIERHADGRYHLTLHTMQAGVDGERSIDGQTCRAVSDAAIVTLALSLDPNLELPKDFGVNRPSPPQSPATKPVERASTVTLRQATVVPSSVRATPTAFIARSILGWRWGSLPESSAELGAGLGLRRGRAAAHLTFALSPTTTANSRQESNAGGSFKMQAAELTACGALIDGTWRLSPCLGISFTRVSGTGYGVVPIRDGTLYWTSAAAALELSAALGRRVGLYARAGAQGALHRPYAYLSGLDRIFQPDPLAYQVVAGAELKIW